MSTIFFDISVKKHLNSKISGQCLNLRHRRQEGCSCSSSFKCFERVTTLRVPHQFSTPSFQMISNSLRKERMSSSVWFAKLFWTFLLRQFVAIILVLTVCFKSYNLQTVHLPVSSESWTPDAPWEFLSNYFVNWMSVAKVVTRSYSMKIVQIMLVMLHHQQWIQPYQGSSNLESTTCCTCPST